MRRLVRSKLERSAVTFIDDWKKKNKLNKNMCEHDNRSPPFFFFLNHRWGKNKKWKLNALGFQCTECTFHKGDYRLGPGLWLTTLRACLADCESEKLPLTRQLNTICVRGLLLTGVKVFCRVYVQECQFRPELNLDSFLLVFFSAPKLIVVFVSKE